MLLPLVVLFVLVPIAELAIVIQVGQAIGAWWTIAVLIADSLLGSVLMRAQGRAIWRRFNEAMQTGRAPATEVLDGGLVILGGACLLTPGFITDVFGLLLLLPPTRAALRRLLVRRFARKMVGGATAGAFHDPGRRPVPDPHGPGHGQAFDVEGTAGEVGERRPLP